VSDKNPYIDEADGQIKFSEAGYKYLDKILTDSTGDVYAFYDEASPVMVAAAMARLSRRGSDLREIFLDEFAMSGDEDASGLIHRVVTAYGDDSVQQLAGLHLVVEGASNLMTKKLEWGRFGAYLEQSTRYIFYDEKGADGNYKYYVPPNLPVSVNKDYIKIHDQIFEIYSKMVRQLTDYVRKNNPEPKEDREKTAWRGATKAQACDAIRPVLPVSTKSTVGIFASAQAVENLIMRLLSENLAESQTTGQSILKQARKVMPAFFERADKPDRGGATTAYMAANRLQIERIISKLKHKKTSTAETAVKLVNYWPKNELDIIPELLFAQSNSSLEELESATAKLSEKEKKQILNDYFGQRLNRRHRPGRALEIPHYEWEVTADYGTFRDLQRHRVADAFEWQAMTTAYGFEVPALVKEAGLGEEFKQCFSLSENLVDLLISNGFIEESQYATLFGHRMRYRFVLNARAAFHFIELRSSPQGHPGYRLIVNQMHELISKVHPIIAQGMIFVNKDEDPELTRMAAELATQFKLEKLNQKPKD
jgi:thymidylate synthase ThyX